RARKRSTLKLRRFMPPLSKAVSPPADAAAMAPSPGPATGLSRLAHLLRTVTFVDFRQNSTSRFRRLQRLSGYCERLDRRSRRGRRRLEARRIALRVAQEEADFLVQAPPERAGSARDALLHFLHPRQSGSLDFRRGIRVRGEQHQALGHVGLD